MYNKENKDQRIHVKITRYKTTVMYATTGRRKDDRNNWREMRQKLFGIYQTQKEEVKIGAKIEEEQTISEQKTFWEEIGFKRAKSAGHGTGWTWTE